MTPEECKAERDRFDRLAVEFWKECREALEPIEKRYGMSRHTGGYEGEDDVMSDSWAYCRSVYSIESEINNRRYASES
jgi:hypothetical protein